MFGNLFLAFYQKMIENIHYKNNHYAIFILLHFGNSDLHLRNNFIYFKTISK